MKAQEVGRRSRLTRGTPIRPVNAMSMRLFDQCRERTIKSAKSASCSVY